MTFEQSLFPFLISLGAAALGAYGITRWRNTKGATSVFAQDSSLEDVGLSALSSLFSTAPTDLGKGRKELRPTWGIRLIAPVVALVFLIFTDLSPFWQSFGVQSETAHLVINCVIGAALGYSWFMLLFVQRIVFDDHYIMSYGIDLRSQSRRLSDLTGIRVHEQRPALVLTFAQQPPLYIPKFLSHRETLIQRLEEISADNLNNGAVPSLPRLRDQVGF